MHCLIAEGDRNEAKESIARFYQMRAKERPPSDGFGGALTAAIFEYFAEWARWRRESTEREDALRGLILTRHQDLIDLFDEEGYEALIFCFGDRASDLREVWLRSFDYACKDGSRIPVRSRYGVEPHFHAAFHLLSACLYLCMRGVEPITFLSRPMEDLEMYFCREAAAELLAYEIDRENAAVRGAIESAAAGNSGKMSALALDALVRSRSSWAHGLLGRVLLAARLQEGLRLSIVSAMFSGDPEAFRCLLRVILDNSLERFSSVVRAIGDRTGLPLAAEKPAMVRHCLLVMGDCVSGNGTKAYLESDNPLENYLALLSLGFLEVRGGLAACGEFLVSSGAARRMVGWYWLSQSGEESARLSAFAAHLDERVPDVLAYMIACLPPFSARGRAVSRESLPDLFDGMRRLIAQTPSGEKRISFPGLPALSVKYTHAPLYRYLIDMAACAGSDAMFDALCDEAEKMDALVRHKFVVELAKRASTPKQRRALLLAAGDRSADICDLAVKALRGMKLTPAEYLELEGMLRLKAESLRLGIILLLLAQEPAACLASVLRLSACEDPNRRRAAEQMVRDMRSDDARLAGVIEEARSAVGAKARAPEAPGEENGYHLFCHERLTRLAVPARDPSVDLRAALPDFDALCEKARTLSRIIERHKDDIFACESLTGSREEIVFGATFLRPLYSEARKGYAPRPFSDYPLADEIGPEIERLFLREDILPLRFALELLSPYTYVIRSKRYMEVVEALYGASGLREKDKRLNAIPYWESHCKLYLFASPIVRDAQSDFDTCYRMALNVFHALSGGRLAEDMLPEGMVSGMPHLRSISPLGVQSAVTFWMHLLRGMTMTPEQFAAYFSLAAAYSAELDHEGDSYLSVEAVARAYEEAVIREDDVYFFLTRPGLTILLYRATAPDAHAVRFRAGRPEFMRLVARLVDAIIGAEVARGEAPSALSALAMKVGRCYGAANFARIVCEMDGRKYLRGYGFSEDSPTKGTALSRLVKRLYPAQGETAQDLCKYPALAAQSAQKLIDAAMYAPQWLEIVESYLRMPGLKKAGIWFHAHLNDAFDAEKKAAVACYSEIEPAEFTAGAFDPIWFHEALNEVGEANFALLYEAAKYIAGGNLHRRSRLFADAAMGKLDRETLRRAVSEKRDKDSLLAYTLVPIKDSADAFERYAFLEAFRKDGRRYGAARRQSEARACEIGLGNLARSMGHADANRFVWQMETQQLRSLANWFAPVELEGLTLRIIFDEDGLASVRVERAGKRLAAIPAARRKEPLARECAAAVKSLREQQKRARATLERAMVRREAFSADELDLLMENPALAAMFKKLLFVSGGAVGFFRDGAIEALDKARACIREEVFIAHPHDFVRAGVWSDWQRYFCREQIRQPFKQVFREYYRPTPDELRERTISRRYAGHQIQFGRAVSLAASRGFSTADGLFKAYHRERIIAEVFAGLTWFTPAQVEPQAIEAIQFRDRDSCEPLNIADIPPVLFSETMRDIDLIVSVAHFGAVDPEASLSTVEMRAALLEALLPLLKLDNVRLERSHALIQGTLGEYAVHLGSGVAHMQAKGMLPIVPVHSGQRGRIFLPFADDDPKTAEVVSKVILLAEDGKIKDPILLGFIRS